LEPLRGTLPLLRPHVDHAGVEHSATVGDAAAPQRALLRPGLLPGDGLLEDRLRLLLLFTPEERHPVAEEARNVNSSENVVIPFRLRSAEARPLTFYVAVVHLLLQGQPVGIVCDGLVMESLLSQ